MTKNVLKNSTSSKVCHFCKKNKYKICVTTPLILNKIKCLIDMKSNNLAHIVEYNICYKCIHNISQIEKFYKSILDKMASNEKKSCFGCENTETISIDGAKLKSHFNQIKILKSFKPSKSLEACPSCAYFMKIIKKYNNYLKDSIKDLEWENALIHVDNINEVTRKFYIPGSPMFKNSKKSKDKLSKDVNKKEMKRKNGKIKKQQSNSIENLTNCLDIKNEKDTSDDSRRVSKRIKQINNSKKTTTDTCSKRKNSKKSKVLLLVENKPSNIESNEEIISENKSSVSEEQNVKQHQINNEIVNVTTIEVTEDEENINHTKELAIPEDITPLAEEVQDKTNEGTKENEISNSENTKNTAEDVTKTTTNNTDDELKENNDDADKVNVTQLVVVEVNQVPVPLEVDQEKTNDSTSVIHKEVTKTTTNNTDDELKENNDDADKVNVTQLVVEEVNQVPVPLEVDQEKTNDSTSVIHKEIRFSDELITSHSNKVIIVLPDTENQESIEINSDSSNDQKLPSQDTQTMSEDDIIFSLPDDENSEKLSEIDEKVISTTNNESNEKTNDSVKNSTSANKNTNETSKGIENSNNDTLVKDNDVVLNRTPRKSHKRIRRDSLLITTPTRKSARKTVAKSLEAQNEAKGETDKLNITNADKDSNEKVIDTNLKTTVALDDNQTKEIVCEQTIVPVEVTENTEEQNDTENSDLNSISNTNGTTNRKRGLSVDGAVSPTVKRNKLTPLDNNTNIIKEKEYEITKTCELETQPNSNNDIKIITEDTRKLMEDLMRDHALEGNTTIPDIMTDITHSSENEPLSADNESFITKEITKELYKIHNNDDDIARSLQRVRENVIDNLEKDMVDATDETLPTVIKSTSITVNSESKNIMKMQDELCKMEKSKIFEEIDQELKEHKSIDEIESMNSIEKLKIFAELDEELNKQCEKIIITTETLTETASTSPKKLETENQNDSIDNEIKIMQSASSNSIITDDDLDNEINVRSYENTKENSILISEDEDDNNDNSVVDNNDKSMVDNIYNLGKNIVDNIFKMNH